MITTSVVFDHRGRTKKGHEGPLEVRITIDRKPFYVNTGIKVLKEEWKYGAIVNRPDSRELNDRLAILLRKIETEVNLCLEKSMPIDVAAIRRKVNDARGEMDEKVFAFVEWAEEQIPLLPIGAGTRKHYDTLARRLREYGKIARWADVTVENIMLFDAYLRGLDSMSDAGVYNYHKCLKALLNRAVSMEKIERSPYDRLKGKIKRGEKENIEYLTESEMLSILELKIESGSLLAMARDVFVFQMYTGMAYADAMAFNIDDYKLVDGVWINRAERIKTGIAYINQLLPPVVAVLERYGMKVPKIDAADYNHTLKLIGEACGIKTRMHSHLARHTFATYMLRNGVKIENLQKMLGHNSVVTTQKYAKVLAMSVHDDFDMIRKKMTRK